MKLLVSSLNKSRKINGLSFAVHQQIKIHWGVTYMIKRISCISIIVALLMLSTSCQGMVAKNSTGETIIKPSENDKLELNILVTDNISQFMKNYLLVEYRKQFEKQYGVKVNYEVYVDHSEMGTAELMAKQIV